jgi:predicted ArsR family transcriptional regulator
MTKITRRRINALSLTLMLKTLEEGHATVHDIRDATGLCAFTVRSYLLTMHREGLVRVVGWEQDSRGRYTTAAYTLGRGKNVPKPAPRNRSETNRLYRQRCKQIEMQNAISGASVFNIQA